MKNTIKYTMILLAAALMASCSDFLEKRPYDAVDPDMAVTGCRIDKCLLQHPHVFKPLQYAYVDPRHPCR